MRLDRFLGPQLVILVQVGEREFRVRSRRTSGRGCFPGWFQDRF